MNFETFQKKVIGWADDRGILKNGNPYTQTLKLISEFGELADALAKDDKDGLIDAIGDCAVVCVILVRMTELEELQLNRTQAEHYPEEVLIGNALSNLSILAYLAKTEWVEEWMEFYTNVECMFRGLQHIANFCNLDFLDCCNSAWQEISERKGYLNEQGVFIKE